MRIMTYNSDDVAVVILAGGQGRRMGGQDKGLLEFNGKPLIEHILGNVSAQCRTIYINANRNIDRYAHYGRPVLSDELGDFQGPLAGFSTALAHVPTPLVQTLPCDCPFLPNDLITRMLESLNTSHSDIAVAHDGQRLQPVYALIKTDLKQSLKDFLNSGDRKIDRWFAHNKMVNVDFSDARQLFENLNSPEDKMRLERDTTT